MTNSGLNLTYKIFKDTTSTLDLTASAVSPNTQTPLCGHNFTISYAYANGSSFTSGNGYDLTVFTGSNTGKLAIVATNISKEKTYYIAVT